MRGRVGIALLLLAGAMLVAGELAAGARDYGRVELAPPCAAKATLPGGSLDARLQRLILRALNRTACNLGSTREQLVLSFSPHGAKRFGLRSDQQVEDALRRGLVEAIDEAESAGDLGSIEARVLRELAERAPVELVLEAVRHADTIAALARLLS